MSAGFAGAVNQIQLNPFDVYAGEIAGGTAGLSAENRAIVERINRRIGTGISAVKFKQQLKLLFTREVGFLKKADQDDLENFVQALEEDFDIPAACFGNLDTVFFCYDFDGNGELSFDEAYKAVRFSMEQYRNSLGGAPKIDVPDKTPEQAGYTVVKVLASGGQGTAKLVTDKRGNQKVLKVYDKSNQNAGSIEDLQEEMKIMRKGHTHQGIATVHEIFQDTGFFYMVGDAYMGGDFESLQEKARAQGVDMNSDWYRGIFYQGFSGLEYLHKKSVVHCDIKEANLMIKYPEYEEPEVVIIDLGLASGGGFGASGCKGTPGYMPPETWDYGLWFPRGDTFSMGVVCVQLLTGNTPNAKQGKPGLFQRGRSMEDVAMYTKTSQPPYEQIQFPGMRDWLEPCLEKDYTERCTPMEVTTHPFFADERGCSACSVM